MFATSAHDVPLWFKYFQLDILLGLLYIMHMNVDDVLGGSMQMESGWKHTAGQELARLAVMVPSVPHLQQIAALVLQHCQLAALSEAAARLAAPGAVRALQHARVGHAALAAALPEHRLLHHRRRPRIAYRHQRVAQG